MASIVMDVLTNIDERSAAVGARKLEQMFEHSGNVAGQSFGANLAAGLIGGFKEGDFDSIGGILSSSAMTARATSAGGVLGAAFAGGIAVAAAAGIVDAAVHIGEAFENINRGLTLSVGASGEALEGLKTRVDALVGSLDTSTKTLGSDFGMLASRLGDASPALETITGHIETLRDRVGNFQLGSLSGAFVQFGLDAGGADQALASIAHSGADAGGITAELFNVIGANVPTLRESGLGLQQIGHFLGEIEKTGVPAAKAVSALEIAEKALGKLKEAGKAPAGEDLPTFLTQVAMSVQQLEGAGRHGEAQQLMESVFGPRRWSEGMAMLNQFLSTLRAGEGAFAAPANYLDNMQKGTQTLDNLWMKLKNTIDAALGPTGINVIDTVSAKMDEFIGWVNAHRDDLANTFKTAIAVIGDLLKVLGTVAVQLGKHKELIELIAIGFAGWKISAAVIAGLETVHGLLVGINALGGASALFGGAAAAPGGALPKGAGLPGEAPGLATLPLIGVGAMPDVKWVPLPAGATDADNKAYADAIGRKDDKAADRILVDVMRGRHVQAPPPGAPGAPGEPKPPGTPPGWIINQPGVAADDRVRNWKPGDPPESAPGGAVPGDIPGGLLTAQDFAGPGRKGPKGPRLPQMPEIPYGPGYGEPPAPGETVAQWEHRQAILEKQHDVAEKEARLNQLLQDINANQSDIQKAKNELLHAQMEEQKAELSSIQKHSDALNDFGVKLDSDFGISKGLAGIADNIVKFVAALAFAPAMGALGAVTQASGGKESLRGASGLIGYAGLMSGMGEESGLPGGGGGSGPHGGRGGISLPALALGGATGNTGASGGGGSTAPYFGQMGGGTVNQSLLGALSAAGIDPAMYPLLQGFSRTEGNNPSGVPTLGFTDSQAGPTLSGHVAALAAQLRNRQSVAGPFPANGTRQEQASWMATVVGQSGVQSDWQGNRQPPRQDYVNNIVSGFGPSYWPGFDQGGTVPGTGPQPAIVHGGEVVVNRDQVARAGGPAAIAQWLSAPHYDAGTLGDLLGGTGGATGAVGGTNPAAIWGIQAAPTPAAPGSQLDTGGTASPQPAVPMPPAGSGGSPGPSGGTAQQGPTKIGGGEPPQGGGYGQGIGATGGGALGMAESAGNAALNALAPGAGIAAQIGEQEIDRAVKAIGQFSGIAVGGLMETILPTGGSELANNSWLTRVAGGLAGAKPQLPNKAGQPSDQRNAATPGPTPESALGAEPSPFTGTVGGNYGDIHHTGVNIEHYHVGATEDNAGQDLSRYQQAQSPMITGQR